MALTFASGKRLSKASAVVTVMPLSFSAWINVSSLASSNGILSICTSAASSGWFMYTDTTGGILAETVSGANDVFVTTTAKVTTGSWFHVAAVWTSTASRAGYVNGSKTSNTTASTAPSGNNITYIGSLYQGGFFDCVGTIAFAAIWNVALADAEITELSSGISPLGVRPSALKAYAPLVSGASTEPDMVSSTGWTLTGAPILAASPKIILPY